MRVIDAQHRGRDRVIGVWEHDGVLIDPGPESTLATVLEGLGEGFEPRAVLLTHIHLDHAGASGALVRRWPELPVHVPEANVQVLTGGETVLGEFRVEYAPGHASHHVAYLHEPTGTALAGDVAGARIPPSDFVIAPTVPPDIDVEAGAGELAPQLEQAVPVDQVYLGLRRYLDKRPAA